MEKNADAVDMEELVRAKASPAAPVLDATTETGRDGQSVTRPRRAWRWRAVPALAALCVVAVLVSQTWRMEESDGIGLEAASTRMDRFKNGILAFKDSARSTYEFAHEFATKTAYWNQRGEKSGPKVRELLEVPSGKLRRVFRPEMRLVLTQIVARHGIRFPTGGNIQEVQALLSKLKPFASSLPTWMQNYSLPYNMSVEGELADTGVHEMRRLGARCLRTMGELNPVTYTSDKFQLAHTAVRRTAESAAAFAEAYFSNPQDVHFIEYPSDNDTLLRFFDECPRYQREVKRNDSALAQASAFKNSSLVTDEVGTMKRSLGLSSSNVTISPKDLSAIYSACAFDYALYNTTSNWCSLMTPSFVATMNYLDDLREFYLIGGGYKINYDMSALLLRQLFSNMRAAISGETGFQGLFFFAHAETTLPLVTLVGLSDKSPLLANFTSEEIKSRSFRTSHLAPFAANIEFRLYQRGVVEILVNGQQRIIPGCDRIYCPIEWLESHWRFYLEQYDFHQDCK